MPWNDHDGPVPRRTEEQLLALARQKADIAGRRHRQQIGAGLATGLVLGVALIAVVARGGEGSNRKLQTVAGAPEAPTALPAPTTTSSLSVGATSTSAAGAWTSTVPRARTALPPSVPLPPAAPMPTSTPQTPSPQSSTTTTILICRDSWNPACGERYWDPPPGPNQPLTVTVGVMPAAPKAVAPVTFRVVVDDPDGSQLLGDGSHELVDFGGGTPFLGVAGHVECAGGFGAWTTPAPVPLHEEFTYEHVYAKACTYTLTLTYESLGNCAYPPNRVTKTVNVTVAA